MLKNAKISVFFIMTLFFFSLGALAAGETVSEREVTEIKEASAPAGEEPRDEYIVTLYEGDLYLYRVCGEDRYLIKKADSPLPREEDIVSLTEGIKTDSLSSALSVFEDFIM